MDNRREHTEDAYHDDTRKGTRSKIIGIIIIVALVLLAGLWIWKAIQVNHVRKEAEEKVQQVREAAAAVIVQTRQEQLRLLSRPIVWAVRTEMLRGNMDQVNLYLTELVREKNFQQIEVANPQGVIIATTNKKNEGKPAAGVGQALSGDSTLVQTLPDSSLLISSPIMGFNNRLGTLLMRYHQAPPSL